MSNLIPFNYQNKQVRTVNKDNEPWFVATDICEILEISNATMALQRLDGDERSKLNLGRQGEVNIINEYGLYNLILGSRKEEAKQFKRWVTHDVIPSIRKNGLYATDELLNDPDLAIKAFTALKEERERNKTLNSENKLLAQEQLTWANRKIIEALVKKLGGTVGYDVAWKDFKKELLYAHGINLNLRITNYLNNTGKKTKPRTLDMIHNDEVPACLSTATALCRNNKIDISEIVNKFDKSA